MIALYAFSVQLAEASAACVQDTSLTAIAATMALSGEQIWPFTADKQNKLTSALYATMPVKPIDIRVTSTQFEPNKRRRRNLLQVRLLP